MADIRDAILAEIERREQAARRADLTWPGPWRYNDQHKRLYDGANAHMDSAAVDLGRYMTGHQPDDALRRYAHYRRVLERHQRPEAVPKIDPGPYFCVACAGMVVDPCEDVIDVARAILPPDVLAAHGIKDGGQ